MRDSKKQAGIFAILISFVKIGIMGFGGGGSLIPLVERELVTSKRALDRNDFTKHTVITSITPGALPVKLGATCGQQLGGTTGSLLCAYAVMLPGVFATVLCMALFALLGADVISYFTRAAVGISAFIIFLLLCYIAGVLGSGGKRAWLLCAAALVLTGGSELHEIVYLLSGSPLLFPVVLDISTINLMIISLYLILAATITQNRGFLAVCAVLTAGYTFCVGRLGAAAGLDAAGKTLLAAMLLFALAAAIISRKGGSDAPASLNFAIIRTIAFFLAIPVVLGTAFCMLFEIPGAAGFLRDVAISTITSFGGGSAYISVADGIFVQGGYIDPTVFYTRLVPVANALPGPILVKIAAGIGYQYAAGSGSALAAWIMAAVTASVAMGACCAVALGVMSIYDTAKNSLFIRNLSGNILPVICGMLISTCFAMLAEALKTTTECGVNSFLALAAMLLWISLLVFINRIKRQNDLVMLAASAAVSVLLLFS